MPHIHGGVRAGPRPPTAGIGPFGTSTRSTPRSIDRNRTGRYLVRSAGGRRIPIRRLCRAPPRFAPYRRVSRCHGPRWKLLSVASMRRTVLFRSYQPSVPSQLKEGRGRSLGTSSGVAHR